MRPFTPNSTNMPAPICCKNSLRDISLLRSSSSCVFIMCFLCFCLLYASNNYKPHVQICNRYPQVTGYYS